MGWLWALYWHQDSRMVQFASLIYQGKAWLSRSVAICQHQLVISIPVLPWKLFWQEPIPRTGFVSRHCSLLFGTKGSQTSSFRPIFMHDRLENGNFLQEQNIFSANACAIWTMATQNSHVSSGAGIPCICASVHALMIFLVKIDRCSMLHSLEVRAPFLDRHVAEFCGCPCQWISSFMASSVNICWKVFAGLLPPQILHRNKRGFQIPVAEVEEGAWKPLMEDMLSPKELKMQGIFNPAFVRNLGGWAYIRWRPITKAALDIRLFLSCGWKLLALLINFCYRRNIAFWINLFRHCQIL